MGIFKRHPPPSPQLFAPPLVACRCHTCISVSLSLTSPVLFCFTSLGLPPFGTFSSSFVCFPGFGSCTRDGCGSSFVFWGLLFPRNLPLLLRLALLTWRLAAACFPLPIALLLPVSLVSKCSLVFLLCYFVRPSTHYSIISSSSLPRSLMLGTWWGSCTFFFHSLFFSLVS